MTVLVTGALGGIGRAITAEFIAAGRKVITQDLRGSSADPVDIEGDLLDEHVLDTLREVVQRDDVTAIVAAHGIACSAAVNATTPEFLARAMRINTLSFMRLYEAINPLLQANGGSYVAISSQAGLAGEANNGPYCASKFALVGWARGRSAVGSAPIRILCPGATETPLLMDALQGMADAEGITLEELILRRNQQTAAGRLGRTAEIGRAARWLADLPTRKLMIAAVSGGEVLT